MHEPIQHEVASEFTSFLLAMLFSDGDPLRDRKRDKSCVTHLLQTLSRLFIITTRPEG